MSDKLLDQDAWAIVEVLGHNTFAGKVSEHVIGGSAFIRVDVPEIPGTCYTSKRSVWNQAMADYEIEVVEEAIPPVPAFTKLIGAGSIYAITPCSEEVAKKIAEKKRVVPVTVLDIPRPSSTRLLDSGSDDDDDYIDNNG